MLQRLESESEKEVSRIIDLAADCVCALYERASSPTASGSEIDRCRRRTLG